MVPFASSVVNARLMKSGNVSPRLCASIQCWCGVPFTRRIVSVAAPSRRVFKRSNAIRRFSLGTFRASATNSSSSMVSASSIRGKPVQAVTAAGAKLAANGERLSVSAPRPLAPELVEELRRAKHEILRLLAAQPAVGNRDLTSSEAVWWCRHFAGRTIHWTLGGYRSRQEAQCNAYGELLDAFRKKYGRRWPAWQCAGCDAPIGGSTAAILAGGGGMKRRPD
jgi:hypothetical protein